MSKTVEQKLSDLLVRYVDYLSKELKQPEVDTSILNLVDKLLAREKPSDPEAMRGTDEAVFKSLKIAADEQRRIPDLDTDTDDDATRV